MPFRYWKRSRDRSGAVREASIYLIDCMSTLTELKNISADDRKMIADAEAMLGPEPSDMGLIKNMFWGRLRSDLTFPYPRETEEHREKADRLLETLTKYLENEHPSISIDQNQEVPLIPLLSP